MNRKMPSGLLICLLQHFVHQNLYHDIYYHLQLLVYQEIFAFSQFQRTLWSTEVNFFTLFFSVIGDYSQPRNIRNSLIFSQIIHLP